LQENDLSAIPQCCFKLWSPDRLVSSHMLVHTSCRSFVWIRLPPSPPLLDLFTLDPDTGQRFCLRSPFIFWRNIPGPRDSLIPEPQLMASVDAQCVNQRHLYSSQPLFLFPS